HDAVTQPFVDADADPRGHGAHRGAERDELSHRLVVATRADEVGEPTEVEKGEGSLDAGADGPMLPAHRLTLGKGSDIVTEFTAWPPQRRMISACRALAVCFSERPRYWSS